MTRRWWIALGVVAVVLAVVHAPIFLGQIVFFRDSVHWTYPARSFLRACLLRGELPHWNSYQALGFPVLADPLYAVFYPPNWLFVLVGDNWVANLVTWLDFAHLLWGTAGIFLLARRLGAQPFAAALAALAWGLSGYTTAQWTIGLLLQAGSWLPWMVLGHLALLDDLRRGRWMVGVVKAALPGAFAFLLGEIFLALMGLGLAVVITATAAYLQRRESPVRARWLLTFGLGWILTLGVGALTLVPASAAVQGSERAGGLSRAMAEEWSLHPARLIELAAADASGASQGFRSSGAVIGEARLNNVPFSKNIYLGASVLALALLAFGRRRPWATMLGVLCGLAVLLALGRHLPVHAIFRRMIVPFAYMRFPEKYLRVAGFALALLAGLGAARLLAGERLVRRLVFLAAALSVVAISAPLFFPADWSTHVRMGAGRSALVVAVLAAAQYLADRRARLAVVGVLLVVDLASALWPLHDFAPRALALTRASELASLQHESGGAPVRLYRSHQVSASTERWLSTPGVIGEEALALQTFITNTATAWGVATVPGYDAAIPARFDRIWEDNLGNGQALLRLLAARYAVLPIDDPRQPDTRAGLAPLSDPVPGARLYRVPGGLPRVYLAGQASIANDDTALAQILDPQIIAGVAAWLAPEGGAQSLGGPAGRAGKCELVTYSQTQVTARCQADRPALAVFVEQFAPGWIARVDGQPAPLWRTNVIMRGLPLDPGTHQIVLEYRTPGLVPAVVLAVLAIAGLLVLGIWGYWPRPRAAITDAIV